MTRSSPVARVKLGLVALVIAAVSIAVPALAQSPLGPTGRSYYYQNGQPVRVYDGGTASRNAYDARLALAVPWKWGPDSISGQWIMSGSLITPYVIVNDTLARFVASFDTTRKAQLDASLISATTTRKYQFPDKAGVFALTSDVSGLLASSNIWTGTNVFSNDVTVGGTHAFLILNAAGNNSTSISTSASVDRAVKWPDADGTPLLHGATQPVGSKTLYTSNTINARDDRFTLKASGDTTKTLGVNLSLLTAARTDSMPDVSGRRVMRANARDFTGQTANITATNVCTSPPAGMYRVTIYGLTTGLLGAGVTVTIGWTDPQQAQTTNAFTLGTAAGSEATMTVPVEVASGSITVTTSGYLTGTYSLYTRVEAL